MNFLFDVDGTLTEPRQKIDKVFSKSFAAWENWQIEKLNSVYLVTGSDRDKTVEQIGVSLWRHVDGVYQNCGNVFYQHGKLIKRSEWKMSDELCLSITEQVEKSRWYGKADNNIEQRVGMLNISTIGRSASAVQRREYFNWDKANGERLDIVYELSQKYPDLSFDIGGEISIDIYPKGKDKSQVLDDMFGKSIFIGDRCEEGGNDHSIAINSSYYYNVTGWKETREILTSLL